MDKQSVIHSTCYPPLAERSYAGDRTIPGIKLLGLWLQQAGFEVNEKIRIRGMQGCLVITAE